MPDLYQPPAQDIELAAVLAALADPVRLAIVKELHDRGELNAGALDVPVSKSTLSHHLKVLREAGVTWTQAQGVERCLTLRYTCLGKQFPGLLDSILKATAKRRSAAARARSRL